MQIPSTVSRFLNAAFFTACFAACAGNVSIERPRTSSFPAASSPHPEKYLLQPNDLLLITFAGEPDYNQQVRIDWRGRIDLPALAGGGASEIQASGITPVQLADRISEFGRQNKILLSQRAQVFVTEFAGRSFVVLGQVNQPGRYFFQRGVPAQIDLEEAIALGGGYTRLARQSLVLVKRSDQVYRLNLRKLATAPGEGHFLIQPGDIITVTERIF